MAAASQILISGTRYIVVNVTGEWAVADETNTVIINKSTLLTRDGVAPGSIRIDEITWAVGSGGGTVGFDYVLLQWDHTVPQVIDYYTDQWYMDDSPYVWKDGRR